MAPENPIRVYLAAPYGSRDRVRFFAHDLRHRGYVVTSTWLSETYTMTPGVQGAAVDLTDEAVTMHVQDDLSDVAHSDVLVLFTEKFAGATGGGGRHVEMGVAMAHLTPVIVIGEPENIFQRTQTCVTNWNEAIKALEAQFS